MNYKLVITASFQRDLDAVLAYIVLSLKNKPAAASLLSSIDKCFDNLERMPLMYSACHDPYLKELGYRKAVIGGYNVVYKVSNDTKAVYIMRLFHGRQDYEKLI